MSKTDESPEVTETDTAALLVHSVLQINRLEKERWFLLGIVYALLIAFLIVVTRSEY